MRYKDKYGRIWDLPKKELCPKCGQPDNCGDCNCKKLTKKDIKFLGGKLSQRENDNSCKNSVELTRKICLEHSRFIIRI